MQNSELQTPLVDQNLSRRFNPRDTSTFRPNISVGSEIYICDDDLDPTNQDFSLPYPYRANPQKQKPKKSRCCPCLKSKKSTPSRNSYYQEDEKSKKSQKNAKSSNFFSFSYSKSQSRSPYQAQNYQTVINNLSMSQYDMNPQELLKQSVYISGRSQVRLRPGHSKPQWQNQFLNSVFQARTQKKFFWTETLLNYLNETKGPDQIFDFEKVVQGLKKKTMEDQFMKDKIKRESTLFMIRTKTFLPDAGTSSQGLAQGIANNTSIGGLGQRYQYQQMQQQSGLQYSGLQLGVQQEGGQGQSGDRKPTEIGDSFGYSEDGQQVAHLEQAQQYNLKGQDGQQVGHDGNEIQDGDNKKFCTSIHIDGSLQEDSDKNNQESPSSFYGNRNALPPKIPGAKKNQEIDDYFSQGMTHEFENGQQSYLLGHQDTGKRVSRDVKLSSKINLNNSQIDEMASEEEGSLVQAASRKSQHSQDHSSQEQTGRGKKKSIRATIEKRSFGTFGERNTFKMSHIHQNSGYGLQQDSQNDISFAKGNISKDYSKEIDEQNRLSLHNQQVTQNKYSSLLNLQDDDKPGDSMIDPQINKSLLKKDEPSYLDSNNTKQDSYFSKASQKSQNNDGDSQPMFLGLQGDFQGIPDNQLLQISIEQKSEDEQGIQFDNAAQLQKRNSEVLSQTSTRLRKSTARFGLIGLQGHINQAKPLLSPTIRQKSIYQRTKQHILMNSTTFNFMPSMIGLNSSQPLDTLSSPMNQRADRFQRRFQRRPTIQDIVSQYQSTTSTAFMKKDQSSALQSQLLLSQQQQYHQNNKQDISQQDQSQLSKLINQSLQEKQAKINEKMHERQATLHEKLQDKAFERQQQQTQDKHQDNSLRQSYNYDTYTSQHTQVTQQNINVFNALNQDVIQTDMQIIKIQSEPIFDFVSNAFMAVKYVLKSEPFFKNLTEVFAREMIHGYDFLFDSKIGYKIDLSDTIETIFDGIRVFGQLLSEALFEFTQVQSMIQKEVEQQSYFTKEELFLYPVTSFLFSLEVEVETVGLYEKDVSIEERCREDKGFKGIIGYDQQLQEENQDIQEALEKWSATKSQQSQKSPKSQNSQVPKNKTTKNSPKNNKQKAKPNKKQTKKQKINLYQFCQEQLQKKHLPDLIQFKEKLKQIQSIPIRKCDVHPLLRLNNDAVDYFQKMIFQKTKIPDFFDFQPYQDPDLTEFENQQDPELLDPQKMQENHQKLMKKLQETDFKFKLKYIPYEKSISTLMSIKRQKSPFFKLFTLVKAVEEITDSVNSFYQEAGVHCRVSLTADELFPIQNYLLMRSGNFEFVIDFVFSGAFMTECLSCSQTGFIFNSFMASYEYVFRIFDLEEQESAELSQECSSGLATDQGTGQITG